MLDMVLQGVLGVLQPINILTLILTVSLGIVIGALPGFGAATGLILVLPLTYSLDPGTAFVALCGVYVGAEYGGSISSILLNTPGTGGAVVTCFDGFPLAQRGKAREALFISNIASFSGGIVSGLVMLFCMPILGGAVLHFGAGEILVLAVIGLLLVGSISAGDPLKGVGSAALGVFMTCIGADAFMGNPRFDFDIPILIGGIPFIPVMLGVFSVPHLLRLALGRQDGTQAVSMRNMSMRENARIFLDVFRDMFARMKILLLRSGLFGVLIGIVPGVGGSVATMVAYSSARRASKQPEMFGKGAREGIAAPEASNNGLVGGSLIPVLALGIPGSPAAAIFMGAIFLHGMTPGPNFLVSQGNLVYLLIMAVFMAAVVQLLLGFLTIGSFANILKVPPYLLFPSLLVICCIGAYVVRGLEFDMWLFSGFGLAAFFLVRLGFNPGAFILGMILGGITEGSLLETLTLARAQGGLLAYFMGRTIALIIIGMVVIYFAWRLFSAWRTHEPRSAAEASARAETREVGPWSGLRGYDAAYSVLLLGICAWLYSMLDELAPSTALFPRIVLTVLMLSMGALLAKTVFFGRLYANKTESPFRGTRWTALSGVLIVWGLYLWGVGVLGFYVSSFLMVLVLTVMLRAAAGEAGSPRSLLSCLVFSVIYGIAAYIVFKIFFGIVTPTGLIG